MPSFVINEVYVGDIVAGDLVMRNVGYDSFPVPSVQPPEQSYEPEPYFPVEPEPYFPVEPEPVPEPVVQPAPVQPPPPTYPCTQPSQQAMNNARVQIDNSINMLAYQYSHKVERNVWESSEDLKDAIKAVIDNLYSDCAPEVKNTIIEGQHTSAMAKLQQIVSTYPPIYYAR